jgi:hypothetical protein|tara:strand:+ start:4026 stop:4226 length:201 start_codon:yes stop_codon:yes gene_type:complete
MKRTVRSRIVLKDGTSYLSNLTHAEVDRRKKNGAGLFVRTEEGLLRGIPHSQVQTVEEFSPAEIDY